MLNPEFISLRTLHQRSPILKVPKQKLLMYHKDRSSQQGFLKIWWKDTLEKIDL